MADSIRQTNFTWDPDRESREAIWNRIKRHVQHELDRIQRETVMRRRVARRLASPSHERNLQVFQESRRGVPVSVLARAHGLKTSRVREIIRAEARWSNAIAPAMRAPGTPTISPRRPWSSPVMPLRWNRVTATVCRDP